MNVFVFKYSVAFYLFELIKKTISTLLGLFIFSLSSFLTPFSTLSLSHTLSDILYRVELILSFFFLFYGQHSPTLVILFLFTYLLKMYCRARILLSLCAHVKAMLSFSYTFRYDTLMFYELSAFTFTKTHQMSSFPLIFLFY